MNQVAFLAAAKEYFETRGFAVKSMGGDEFEARNGSERCNVFVWESREVRISSAKFASDLAEIAGVLSLGTKVPGGVIASYTFFRI